jgi:hypothetical protein
VKSEFTDVALEAPPLALDHPPQAMLDRRFHAEPPPAFMPSKVKRAYNVLASLVTKNPVRIRTNLLPDEIPVALGLRLGSRLSLDGTVEIEPMPVKLFRRTANLRHLKFTFHDGLPAADLDGELTVQEPDITVRILILGNTGRPVLEFLSDPPLSRQQIVSVLLFNKSVDELDDSEAYSAGSFSQATADGALGLFAFFFLSGTPIESIAYDPVSETYSAKVRIGQKTSLSVGSDFGGGQQVELRRRLGGRWAVRTEVHSQQGEPDSLLTLLEWFKRF